MRILICKKVGGAFGHITDSWINALQQSGFETKRYDGNISSWTDFDPDLFIGCSGHWQPIPKNTKTKIAIHVNPYGQSIPGIDESANVIENVKKHKPTVVFGYGFEQHRKYWYKWEHDGIPWVPMPTAGDATKYRNLNIDRVHDIVYLGGKWAYKSKTMDQYLLPVIRSGKFKSMIYGWGDWDQDLSRYIMNGPIVPLDEGNENGFFNTGKVAPCMSEIHTYHTGIDLPERYFKVVLAGCLAVHDGGTRVKEILKEAEVANDHTEYFDLINKYVFDHKLRKMRAASQYQEIIGSHTYHHRLSNLLIRCGYVDEGTRMLESLKSLMN